MRRCEQRQHRGSDQRRVQAAGIAPNRCPEPDRGRTRDQRCDEPDQVRAQTIAEHRSHHADEADHGRELPARCRGREDPDEPGHSGGSHQGERCHDQSGGAGDGAEQDPAIAPSDHEGQQSEGKMRFGDPRRHDEQRGAGRRTVPLPGPVGEHQAESEHRRPLRLHEHRPRAHSGERGGTGRDLPRARRAIRPLHAPHGEHHREDEHRKLDERPEPVCGVERQKRRRQDECGRNRGVDKWEVSLAVGSDQGAVQRRLDRLAVEVAGMTLAEQRPADVERGEVASTHLEAADLRPDDRVGDQHRRGDRRDQPGRPERSAHLRQPIRCDRGRPTRYQPVTVRSHGIRYPFAAHGTRRRSCPGARGCDTW